MSFRKIINTLPLLAFFLVLSPAIAPILAIEDTGESNQFMVNQWIKSISFKKDLNLGDHSHDVFMLETYLNKKTNYFPYVPDLDFDEKTDLALSHWQVDNELPVTGELDAASRQALSAQIADSLCPSAETKDTDIPLTLLNALSPLPTDYKLPEFKNISLTVPSVRISCVAKIVYDPLVTMFKDAEADGVKLSVTYGYRDQDTQKNLYESFQKTESPVVAAHIALPGHSEHHLGTALDIGYVIDKKHKGNGYIWLAKHGTEYGFVMSYPKGKETITGYQYEPWHYRYVGQKVAAEIKQQGTTLQQYLALREDQLKLSKVTTASVISAIK